MHPLKHRCLECGLEVTDDLVKTYWMSRMKDFRAFLGRCGPCFDAKRIKWDAEDRKPT